MYSNFKRGKLGLLAYKCVDGSQHFVLPGGIEQKRSMIQSLHDSGIDTMMAQIDVHTFRVNNIVFLRQEHLGIIRHLDGGGIRVVMMSDSGSNIQGSLEPVKVARDIVRNIQFSGSKVLYKALYGDDKRHVQIAATFANLT